MNKKYNRTRVSPNTNIHILGAGSWGTALAIQFASHKQPVYLWGHDKSKMLQMQQTRTNPYLPNIQLPDNIICTNSLDKINKMVLIATPSFAFLKTLKLLKTTSWKPAMGLAWATKGLDTITHQFLHQIVSNTINADMPMAVLSGPTFAIEVAKQLPTALTIAGTHHSFNKQWAEKLYSDNFRCYTSDDLIGVEIAGATKNIIAIASGVSDGLGFGANARSAIITRGLHEIMLLGQKYHANPKTFMGLAGIGDLSLTCSNNQSRNRQLGLLLATGVNFIEAQQKIGQALEGANAAKTIQALAKKQQINMPITDEVVNLISGKSSPMEAAKKLLRRNLTAE